MGNIFSCRAGAGSDTVADTYLDSIPESARLRIMRFLSGRPNDPNWMAFLAPADALLALDYVNGHSGEARSSLLGKGTGYFEVTNRELCFQFAVGGQTFPLGIWFHAMEKTVPDIQLLYPAEDEDEASKPVSRRRRLFACLGWFSKVDDVSVSTEIVRYDPLSEVHASFLKFLLHNYLPVRKLDISKVNDIAVATSILCVTEGSLLSLTCASSYGIDEYCAGLQELHIRQLPNFDHCIWETIGESLLSIRAHCELIGARRTVKKMKSLCPNLTHVYLASTDPRDFCAPLLVSYGEQLLSAKIGHCSTKGAIKVRKACPNAEFQHTNSGSEFTTMNILAGRLVSCSLFLHGTPDFQDMAAAADCLTIIGELSLWVYQEDDSVYWKSLAALFRTPKKKLRSLELFATVKSSWNRTLRMFADKTGGLRELSFCSHLYNAGEKFTFWPLANANPFLEKVTVRIPCNRIGLEPSRHMRKEKILRVQGQVMDIIETFVEQCKLMRELIIEPQIRNFCFDSESMERIRRAFFAQKREQKNRFPHVEVFGVNLF